MKTMGKLSADRHWMVGDDVGGAFPRLLASFLGGGKRVKETGGRSKFSLSRKERLALGPGLGLDLDLSEWIQYLPILVVGGGVGGPC